MVLKRIPWSKIWKFRFGEDITDINPISGYFQISSDFPWSFYANLFFLSMKVIHATQLHIFFLKLLTSINWCHWHTRHFSSIQRRKLKWEFIPFLFLLLSTVGRQNSKNFLQNENRILAQQVSSKEETIALLKGTIKSEGSNSVLLLLAKRWENIFCPIFHLYKGLQFNVLMAWVEAGVDAFSTYTDLFSVVIGDVL